VVCGLGVRSRVVSEIRNGALGEVREVDALGGRCHHHSGQAGPGLPQLERHHGAASRPESGGELRQPGLHQDRRRV
jgi:hypothetical protein